MKKNLEPLKDALEELADFARKMEPTEYAHFYRLMERMENNVEICILVRDDRLEKLEAMTCVCSVGLDMIAVEGDVSASTISAIIADEAAIGMINNKTTAVRLIPVPGKKIGDSVNFGGLLGYCPIVPVKNKYSSEAFIARGGRIPAPIRSLTN